MIRIAQKIRTPGEKTTTETVPGTIFFHFLSAPPNDSEQERKSYQVRFFSQMRFG
jgi:hypothetical protein